jgi:hypothetical protein
MPPSRASLYGWGRVPDCLASPTRAWACRRIAKCPSVTLRRTIEAFWTGCTAASASCQAARPTPIAERSAGAWMALSSAVSSARSQAFARSSVVRTRTQWASSYATWLRVATWRRLSSSDGTSMTPATPASAARTSPSEGATVGSAPEVRAAPVVAVANIARGSCTEPGPSSRRIATRIGTVWPHSDSRSCVSGGAASHSRRASSRRTAGHMGR